MPTKCFFHYCGDIREVFLIRKRRESRRTYDPCELFLTLLLNLREENHGKYETCQSRDRLNVGLVVSNYVTHHELRTVSEPATDEHLALATADT